MDHIDWNIHGVELRLLADCGLYWPAARTLFAADLHLGKEAVFAQQQIAVPRGSTAATLQRISGMLHATSASRLCVLGDLFHQRSALAADIVDHWSAFRLRHKDVAVQLLPGNHDRGVRAFAAQLHLQIIEPLAGDGPFTLRHHPGPPAMDKRLALAGHLHPAVRLSMAEFRGKRAPCFYLHRDCLILPAAGEFTGTALVSPTSGDRTAILVEGRIIDLPAMK